MAALFGELVQHQPLQFGHVGMRDRVARLEMMQRAEHPADRVAQLAIGLDGVLEDLRADALVVGIVGGADPEPQDIGAGILHHLLRLDGVADRLRHLAAVLVEREAVGQHDVERRAAAGAAAFQQRRLEPAAMLVASLPDTSRCRRRHRPCARCRRGCGKCWRSSSTKAWVEPESNQTSQMSSTFFQSSLASEPRKRSRAPSMYQASAPSSIEGLGDALVDDLVLQDLGGAVALLAHEHRDRHAPGALARDHPVGLAVDHAVDAVLARLAAPIASPRSRAARGRAACRRALALPLSAMSLSIAMNHCGVLRKITGFFERQECGY